MSITDGTQEWSLRGATESDPTRWAELYRGYRDVYRVEPSDDAVDHVWSWIQDPNHEVQCLLVGNDVGRVVGLAHYRAFARPLSASTGCFLDDLFVDPAERGTGVADAILAELRRLAAINGWTVVRWLTADDNYRGRAKYDRHATRTTWITYDMPPD